MTKMPLRVTGGVDTHLDVYVAAALDHRGALLGVESFETTPAGYRGLLGWLRGFGEVELVGAEGTGSYVADLTRCLRCRMPSRRDSTTTTSEDNVMIPKPPTWMSRAMTAWPNPLQ